MLSQTLDKQIWNSALSRKVKSNTPIHNFEIQQYPSRVNLHTAYQSSSSTTNLQGARIGGTIPTRKQFTNSTERVQNNKPLKYLQYEHFKQLPVSVNSNLIKTKSEIMNIPLLKQPKIDQSCQTKTQRQQLILNSDRRTISPFRILNSQTERQTITPKNDIEVQHYQREINSLKQQLSQSFNDKLSLELKLNKTIQFNKDLQTQVKALKKQIQLQLSPTKDKNNHSLTINNQNDTILQLLNEYQDTKKIIQKLMQDNEQLLKRNDQLMHTQIKVSKLTQEVEKFKIIVVKTQNQKFSLLEKVEYLSSQLDRQREYKYSLLRQIQDIQKIDISNQQSNKQISKLQEEIQTLKNQIIRINNKNIKEQNNQIYKMKQTNSELKQQIQQYIRAMNSKDKQIIILKEELTETSNKLKQVFGELIAYSQSFKAQKNQLLAELKNNKMISQKQIFQLKQELLHQHSKTNNSKPNTLLIEPSDLKETKTRITGGYEQVILGQNPPIPVVASVRGISDLDITFQN